jgi:SAM-dependent methyltransferase
MTQHQFDRAYYQRFYRNPRTRVASQRDVDRLGDFVCSYLKYLRLPVRSVLDVGCGLGFWKSVVARRFPRARYVGVEYSAYLCETKGWIRGSVVDFQSETPFDLVICQGVLQYLSPRDAERAIANLARLSRAAVYLEVLTRDDWKSVCDQAATDGRVDLRSAAWYRKRLARRFTAAGGGVFLKKDAPTRLYALEAL